MWGSQKVKGKRGERELARLLTAQLGFQVLRNLTQTRREGGADLDLPGWSLEVKRAALPNIAIWWKQCLEQAERSGTRPALAYRLDRRPWRVMVRLVDIADRCSARPDLTADLCLAGFCSLVEGDQGQSP